MHSAETAVGLFHNHWENPSNPQDQKIFQEATLKTRKNDFLYRKHQKTKNCGKLRKKIQLLNSSVALYARKTLFLLKTEGEVFGFRKSRNKSPKSGKKNQKGDPLPPLYFWKYRRFRHSARLEPKYAGFSDPLSNPTLHHGQVAVTRSCRVEGHVD